MTQSKNTTTQLNPGTGGDQMDEQSVTQPPQDTDAALTTAKRAAVAVGFDSDDAEARLVGPRQPLPVLDRRMLEVLQEMAADIREMRELLVQFISS